MASVSFASPLRVLDDVSGGQSGQMLMPNATWQADGPNPNALLDRSPRGLRSGKRFGTWHSDSDQSVQSTEAEDIESEGLASELEGPASPRDSCHLVGRVMSLSCSADGCRQVQDALDNASSDKQRELLVKELHGQSVKAMRCPHANHVLQKCINVMPPASLQFMIDELLSDTGLVKKVAMHRYGSRIVQQLLKKCGPCQVDGLAEALLRDFVVLSCHTFGNFAVQHLLQFGTAEHQYLSVRSIEQNMGSIARSPYGVGVVAAAMKHACKEDRVWIARALLQDPSLLPSMALMRYGEDVVAHVVLALIGREREAALKSLAGAKPELLAARYGRKVHAYLEKCNLIGGVADHFSGSGSGSASSRAV